MSTSAIWERFLVRCVEARCAVEGITDPQQIERKKTGVLRLHRTGYGNGSECIEKIFSEEMTWNSN